MNEANTSARPDEQDASTSGSAQEVVDAAIREAERTEQNRTSDRNEGDDDEADGDSQDATLLRETAATVAREASESVQATHSEVEAAVRRRERELGWTVSAIRVCRTDGGTPDRQDETAASGARPVRGALGVVVVSCLVVVAMFAAVPAGVAGTQEAVSALAGSAGVGGLVGAGGAVGSGGPAPNETDRPTAEPTAVTHENDQSNPTSETLPHPPGETSGPVGERTDGTKGMVYESLRTNTPVDAGSSRTTQTPAASPAAQTRAIREGNGTVEPAGTTTPSTSESNPDRTGGIGHGSDADSPTGNATILSTPDPGAGAPQHNEASGQNTGDTGESRHGTGTAGATQSQEAGEGSESLAGEDRRSSSSGAGGERSTGNQSR